LLPKSDSGIQGIVMNEPSLSIGIKLLSPKAKIPQRSSDQAAGWDIYCQDDVSIWPGMRKTIPTGIAIAVPAGYYGLILGRSGLASKKGLDALGGVIDSDYRGEIHVILYNTSDDNAQFNSGDRIAQLVFMPHYHANWLEMEELPATERGTAGLGSTGK
jgi:dUTP pyrophosphatase